MDQFGFHRKPCFIAVTAAVLCCAMTGCQQYGDVSPRAYEVAKALYSVCNRQDAPGLAAVEAVISTGVAASELTASEEEWLLAIVEKARAGEWTYAMQDARVMMSEQVH